MRKVKVLALTGAVAGLAALLAKSPIAVADYGKGSFAVTVGTCAGASYPTIQAGVAAASPGGTVYVCPGIYQEQVEIAKNLNLIGIASNNQKQAVLLPPVAGLQTTAPNPDSSPNPIAYEIWAHDSYSINIQNLTIDGTGNLLPDCTNLMAGILYQNASGVVNQIATRNDRIAALPACRTGIGVLIQSSSSGHSYVTVENSSIHDYQAAGIAAIDEGTHLTAYKNGVRGDGPNPNVPQKGIEVASGATGGIYYNAIADHVWSATDSSDFGFGIYIFGAPSVNIDNNVIANDQISIGSYDVSPSEVADGGFIANNLFVGATLYDAIDLCSNKHFVLGNVTLHSTEAGVFLDDQCGSSGNSNLVSNNNFNEDCAGILVGPNATGNRISGNAFFNSSSEQLTGDSCP